MICCINSSLKKQGFIIACWGINVMRKSEFFKSIVYNICILFYFLHSLDSFDSDFARRKCILCNFKIFGLKNSFQAANIYIHVCIRILLFTARYMQLFSGRPWYFRHIGAHSIDREAKWNLCVVICWLINSCLESQVSVEIV